MGARCWCDWRENYATDCYFYSEDKDMGASIPWCSYAHCILEDGDCSKSCKRYICGSAMREANDEKA